MLRVLIIDDEKNIRATLTICLESMGCEVRSAGSPDEAFAAVAQRPFDLVFLDLRLRETSGLDLLPKLLAESPGLGIVVLTAYATIETAVEALEARRDRLSAQALYAGADSPSGQSVHAAPTSRVAAGRIRPATETNRPGNRPGYPLAENARGDGSHRSRGPDRFDRAASRRKRDRQGRAGPHPAPAQPPP